MGNPILFIILAVIAIIAGGGMLLSRNALYSALFLILNMGTIAVLYLVLNAPFIAMVQITVYAGAIMVLFLFVIMLLGAERLQGAVGGWSWQLGLAITLALGLAGSLAAVLLSGEASNGAAADLIDSSPTAIGLELFESYVFPFEITSILLLVAMIGVVVLRTQKRGNNA